MKAILSYFTAVGTAHLCVGAITVTAAILFFFLVRKRFVRFYPSLLTAIFSAIVSFFLTIGLCRLKTYCLSARGVDISVNFCVAYALLLFVLTEAIFLPRFSDPKDLNLSFCVCPLVLALSRFACVLRGCCGGLLCLTEIALCAASFPLLLKKKLGFSAFIAIYFLYRFLIEFFKPSYGYEKFHILSAFQICCLVLTALSTGTFCFIKSTKKPAF